MAEKLGWFTYIKMLFQGKTVVAEAVKQGQIVKDVHAKSSWKSTEFWVAALSGAAAVAGQAAGFIPPPYGAIVAAGGAIIYQISRGMAKHADPEGGVKPGIATTEFAANMAANVGAALAAIGGAVSPEVAVVLAAASNSAYVFSRGLAKSGEQPAK